MAALFFAFLLLFGFGDTKEHASYPFSKNFHQAQPDTGEVIRLLDMAYEDINASNYIDARNKIEQAREWSNQLDFPKGKELVALRLGDIYLNTQFFDSAQVVLENALKTYPDSEYKIQLYNLLATAYRYQENLLKAIEMYQEVLKLAEEENLPRMIAAVHQNIAVAYIGIGKKVEGLNSYLFSIDYAEQARDTAFMVIAYNNLGDTYNGFGDYEQSEFYLQKSYELAREKNLQSDLLRATTNLANLKSNQRDFDQALTLYQEALDLFKEVRPNTPPFQILYNLGNLKLKMYNPDEAIPYFEESLQYCLELNVPPGVYYNYVGLGTGEAESGNEQAICDYFSRFKGSTCHNARGIILA